MPEPKVTTSCPQQGPAAGLRLIDTSPRQVFLHSGAFIRARRRLPRLLAALTILWLRSAALAHIGVPSRPGSWSSWTSATTRSCGRAARHVQGLGRSCTLPGPGCGPGSWAPAWPSGLAALQCTSTCRTTGLTGTSQPTPSATWATSRTSSCTATACHTACPSAPSRGLHSLDRLLLHQNRVARVAPRTPSGPRPLLMALPVCQQPLPRCPRRLAPLRSLQYLRLNGNPGCAIAGRARPALGLAAAVPRLLIRAALQPARAPGRP